MYQAVEGSGALVGALELPGSGVTEKQYTKVRPSLTQLTAPGRC